MNRNKSHDINIMISKRSFLEPQPESVPAPPITALCLWLSSPARPLAALRPYPGRLGAP